MLKSKKVNLPIIIITILIIITLVAIGIVSGIQKQEAKKESQVNDYERPISAMYSSLENKDVKGYLSAFPEFIGLDVYFDQDYMNHSVENLEAQYGTDVKISYTIQKKEVIVQDDLKQTQELILNYYNTNVTISEGFLLDVKTIYTGSKSSQTDMTNLTVYNIDGNWYLLGL